ncbi:hypothetical protein BCR34DRAFT_661382 [Clohesyomyces aquaticus]|uniref:NADP-dependent L-serine/L-allo-threonine dehydrogenase ydfG n=1 Tax=Clohesyomyces aquaticus TaxID=1231657 RepID=A0A1Y2A3K0_9PLEO|nr:hypothetical protein BCR34DRAFT_661382 [Clohesyomyces aquaticus]
MSLKGKNIVITGASKGIGAAIAKALAHQGCTLVLFSRSLDDLSTLAEEIPGSIKPHLASVDISSYEAISSAIRAIVPKIGPIDILINNAGLALGAPSAFSELRIEDIIAMTNTNINGLMFTTYAVLNEGKMRERGRGTILNITSVTGLEVPPFPGEAVYHSCKAAQEAFTNVLRNELAGTDIKVLALRPGVVATHFHEQRVGYDVGMYEEFMRGYEPLVAEDVAEAAEFMLCGMSGGQRICDCVSTASIIPAK